MISLKGRTTLITGGSRGIGRAAAILLAEAGSDIAFNYACREKAALEVKAEVEKRGRNCLIYKTDISHEVEVVSMVGDIIEKWRHIDILVNNAGIWTYLEMGAMNADILKETIEVNLNSMFYFCNAVVPHMKKNRLGWIINIGSTAGVRGEALHSHYAATKGAMHAFTKSLAAELGPWNIRVNCVAPGWVDTDMCTQVFSDAAFKESVVQSIPLRRIPPPEDIAGPILFLASDLARHVNGAIINVNGGSVLCG
ncbi:MAG: SDR family NAD(P)-dependent oxidoreductase [Candidatus Aminicenantales bacterium]|jgi:3-oxoacyl-[acyl-carrier protein] reductase